MRLLRRLTPMLACMASQYAVLATNFTRSGRIYLATASVRDLGIDGYLWYSTAYTMDRYSE